ncbi:hypothetical protein IWW36_004943 [Coemansia brasiliensis]|uniref:Uncharacterized protein n=1 Tax=Coemansia brasiliensis TaxID=2650707 RepID=A0A9W8I2E3_9FUNG|nr:hypothetical protein IWW36_004943 [Coemansia brasiliensis]
MNWLFLVLYALVALVYCQLSARPTLHIFGDSLSDIGRLKSLTHGRIPPSAYWNGRFCSGPVWNEYLALLLNAQLKNYAVGVAKATTVHRSFLGVLPLDPPTTLDQITGFGLNGFVVSTMDYAILEIGSNDVASALVDIVAGKQTAYEFAQNLSTTVVGQLQMLYDIGFRRIIVFNLPALDQTPIVIQKDRSMLAHVLVFTYNRLLKEKAMEWAHKHILDRFQLVDLTQFMLAATQPNAMMALNITNKSEYCISGSWLALFEDHLQLSSLLKFAIFANSADKCADASSFFFFDPIHPSERVQRLFGYYMYEYICKLDAGLPPLIPSAETLLNLTTHYKLYRPVAKPVAIY